MGALFFISAGTFRYWHAWAFLGVLFIPMFFVLVMRIKSEEALLESELPGYEEYMEKVKYRLIPGVW